MLFTLYFLIGVGVQAPQAAPATVVPLAAQTSAQADAYFSFLQARTLAEDDAKVIDAIAAYRKAIASAPNSPDIHADLAELLARGNHVDEALAEADAALKLDPANRSAHRLYGLIDAALADHAPPAQSATLTSQAISHLEQARALLPGDLSVQLTLGRLYVDTKEYAKSIAIVNDFLLAEPGYSDALLLLAEAYDATNQTVLAVGALEQLVKAEPQMVAARSRLAELDEVAGRWTDAAANWNAMITLSPNYAEQFRVRRANALMNAGDLDGARQALLDATKATPSDIAAWYLMAQLGRRSGDATLAADAAQHITDLDTKDPRGVLASANAKAAAHDFAGEVAVLEPLYNSQLSASGPADVLLPVASAMSAALEAAGDKARAVSVLEAAKQHDPTDVALQIDLASAYEHAGQLDRAETLLRGIITKDPDEADALNVLGYMLADHGKKLDDAVSLIKRALVIDADNPSYLDSLGWAYFKQGKYPDAVPALEHAADAMKQNSLIQDHLGELYFQLKRYRDAASAWTRALGGDRESIDVAAVTKKRDRAQGMAK